MVISDAHKALFGCNHLGCTTMILVASCIPFPSFVLCHVMLTMLGCTTRWLYMHHYTLAYMSMHESCLLLCHPYFNPIKSWTSDPNLHLSLTNATFYLFSYLFVSLFVSCFLVSLLVHFWCNHLGCITMMLVALCKPFPSSVPCHVMLTMLGCAIRWLYMHLYTLAYMSMYESCLLVCRPYFNTIKS